MDQFKLSSTCFIVIEEDNWRLEKEWKEREGKEKEDKEMNIDTTNTEQ